jgi:hypothetical protein
MTADGGRLTASAWHDSGIVYGLSAGIKNKEVKVTRGQRVIRTTLTLYAIFNLHKGGVDRADQLGQGK